MHVDIFVDYQYALSEHRLAERPDGVHHFTRLTRVGFANRDNHEVVKDAFDGKVYIDDLGDRQLHQRQEDAFDGLAHPAVFHGWLADDSGRIDRIFAVRDAGDVENRVLIVERIKSGVIAKRTFDAEFIEVDVAFENDFCVGGNFQIDGLALYEFHGLLTEESGDDELFDVGGRGD